ncbi:hypothetical protein [Mycobacteroides chelonae]|uniref:hypothetical protein n=1 Tax=Mycobacteroides chelonae TaxID=1774 RepID=UPI000F506723|nr:hypothetical protein [Mycobacteroides chelonae]
MPNRCLTVCKEREIWLPRRGSQLSIGEPQFIGIFVLADPCCGDLAAELVQRDMATPDISTEFLGADTVGRDLEQRQPASLDRSAPSSVTDLVANDVHLRRNVVTGVVDTISENFTAMDLVLKSPIARFDRKRDLKTIKDAVGQSVSNFDRACDTGSVALLLP